MLTASLHIGMGIIEHAGRLVPDAVLQKYLLDDLNAVLRSAVERLYFMSDNLHERLEMIEAELVDDYVCGRLSTHQRLRFTDAYLTSPRRRDNVAITSDLLDCRADPDPGFRAPLAHEKRRWLLPRFSVGVVALFLLFFGAWIFQGWRPAVFTIVVSAELSGSRSPADSKGPISVPGGPGRVRFEIHPREPRRLRYRAVLKLGRRVVETAAGMDTPDGGAVAINVPRSILKTGTYSIELTKADGADGAGPPEEYRFELLVRP